MPKNLFLLFIVVFSGAGFADNLQVDIHAKDIAIKGTFVFQPGSALKISGKDLAGKPYDLEVVSNKLIGNAMMQIVCSLNHDNKKHSVAMIAKRDSAGTIKSGQEGQAPDLQLEAKWTQ